MKKSSFLGFKDNKSCFAKRKRLSDKVSDIDEWTGDNDPLDSFDEIDSSIFIFLFLDFPLFLALNYLLSLSDYFYFFVTGF